MARALRIECAVAAYHITSRGNAGGDIFLDDADRRGFVEILGARPVRDPGDWEWSSYRATAGQAEAHDPFTVDWILSQLHSDRARAARAQRTFVDRGRGAGSPARPW